MYGLSFRRRENHASPSTSTAGTDASQLSFFLVIFKKEFQLEQVQRKTVYFRGALSAAPSAHHLEEVRIPTMHQRYRKNCTRIWRDAVSEWNESPLWQTTYSHVSEGTAKKPAFHSCSSPALRRHSFSYITVDALPLVGAGREKM